MARYIYEVVEQNKLNTYSSADNNVIYTTTNLSYAKQKARILTALARGKRKYYARSRNKKTGHLACFAYME